MSYEDIYDDPIYVVIHSDILCDIYDDPIYVVIHSDVLCDIYDDSIYVVIYRDVSDEHSVSVYDDEHFVFVFWDVSIYALEEFGRPTSRSRTCTGCHRVQRGACLSPSAGKFSQEDQIVIWCKSMHSNCLKFCSNV